MKPEEIKKLVEFMGWDNLKAKNWNPHLDISDAWMLVKRARNRGNAIQINSYYMGKKIWRVNVYGPSSEFASDSVQLRAIEDESECVAICKAVLKLDEK